MVFGALAAWSPTDQSRQLAGAVVQTYQRLEWTRDEFAERAGYSVKQLSDCLTLKRPFNLWRLAECGADFFRTFIEVLAERHGCLVFDKDIVTLILTVESRPKPLAKATLTEDSNRRTA